MSDKKYTCTFDSDEITLKKAIQELHENPSDRLSSVNALKEWVLKQKYMKCPLDTPFLLRFLRGAKFSQLKAREMLQGYLSNQIDFPQWSKNIDPRSEKMNFLFDSGYGFPLPNYDKMGRKVLFYRIASVDADLVGDGKKLTVDDLQKYWVMMAEFVNNDERSQVHGFVLLFDYTGVNMKYMKQFNRERMKKWNHMAENRLPGRMKGFHLYNAGTIIELLMAIVRPFLKKKYLERFVIHENLESIYELIDKKNIPSEYLPDDYNGPTSGNIKEICDSYRKEIQSEKWVKHFHDMTSGEKYGIDLNNKPKSETEMFRKLNVD